MEKSKTSKEEQRIKGIEATKRWKEQHRDHVLQYHRKYNKERDNYKNCHGKCECCGGKVYFSLPQHYKSKKHERNLNAFKNT